MKLLSINLARTIWLAPLLDFNPRGIRLDKILFPFLIETYKFKKYPSLTEHLDPSKGAVFEEGEFLTNEKSYPIGINLTIYPDGFVVDTRSSTENSEAFLEDAFSKFSEIFKIPLYQSIIREKLYVSEVYVSTDKSLEILNPKLKQISEYLSQNVEKGQSFFQLGGVSFWPDQIAKTNPRSFIFERCLNTPFSENRYFSAAALPTEKHLELLDMLEDILS